MTTAGPPFAPPRPRPPWWAVTAFVVVGLSLLTVGSFRLYVAYAGTPVRATIDKLNTVNDNDGTTYRAEFHYELAGVTHRGKQQVGDRLRGLLHDGNGGAGPGTVPARAVRLPGGRAVCLLEDGPLTWLMLAVGTLWFAVAAPAGLAAYRRAYRRA